VNGSDVKKLRTDADLTQQDLADLLKVSRKTVNTWEHGGEISRVNELAIRKVIADLIDLKFDD
jgi:DNA-binding XRE family transcriptional regulator